MSITYGDLIEKSKQVERMHSFRMAALLESAEKLVDEYRGSLAYGDKETHKLVTLGKFLSEEGEEIFLSHANIGDDYRLRFTLFTDLSVDNESRKAIGVPIEMFSYQGRVAVIVGSQKNIEPFIIPSDNSAYSYHQTCIAIKNEVLRLLEAKLAS